MANTEDGRPRRLLDQLSHDIEDDYEVWYDRNSTRCYQWYLGLQIVVFLTGAATSITAALTTGANYDRWPKYVIVLLPIVSSLAAVILSQVRLYDLWKLREGGRIQAQALALQARGRAASAQNDQECSKAYEDLTKMLNELEIAQGAAFFGMYSPDLLLGTKVNKGTHQATTTGTS